MPLDLPSPLPAGRSPTGESAPRAASHAHLFSERLINVMMQLRSEQPPEVEVAYTRFTSKLSLSGITSLLEKDADFAVLRDSGGLEFARDTHPGSFYAFCYKEFHEVTVSLLQVNGLSPRRFPLNASLTQYKVSFAIETFGKFLPRWFAGKVASALGISPYQVELVVGPSVGYSFYIFLSDRPDLLEVNELMGRPLILELSSPTKKRRPRGDTAAPPVAPASRPAPTPPAEVAEDGFRPAMTHRRRRKSAPGRSTPSTAASAQLATSSTEAATNPATAAAAPASPRSQSAQRRAALISSPVTAAATLPARSSRAQGQAVAATYQAAASAVSPTYTATSPPPLPPRAQQQAEADAPQTVTATAPTPSAQVAPAPVADPAPLLARQLPLSSGQPQPDAPPPPPSPATPPPQLTATSPESPADPATIIHAYRRTRDSRHTNVAPPRNSRGADPYLQATPGRPAPGVRHLFVYDAHNILVIGVDCGRAGWPRHLLPLGPHRPGGRLPLLVLAMASPLLVPTMNVRGLNGDPAKLARSSPLFPEVFGDVIVVTETKLPAPGAAGQPLIYSQTPALIMFTQSMSNYLCYHSTQHAAAAGGCAVLINRNATIRSAAAELNCVAVHAVYKQLEFTVVGVYVNPTLQAFSANRTSLQFIYNALADARAAGRQVFLAGDFNCVADAGDRSTGVADETPAIAAMRENLLDAWPAAATQVPERDVAHEGTARGATYVTPRSWSRIDRIYSDVAPAKATVRRLLDPSFDHFAACAEYATPGGAPPKRKLTSRDIAKHPEFPPRAMQAVAPLASRGGSLAGFLRLLRRAAVACTARSSEILALESQADQATDPAARTALLAAAQEKRAERRAKRGEKQRVNDTLCGERFTRFFFDRSRSRETAPFPGLHDDHNVLRVEPTQALNVAHRFYSSLYAEPPALDRARALNFISAARVPSLSPTQARRLGAPFSEAEFLAAIRQLRNRRAPGDDGIPSELLRCVAAPLASLCAKHWPAFVRDGCLPEHLRGSTIVLLQKKGKDPRHIGNLRPVALLNSLYKVFAKAVAIRLGPILEEWIHPFQTGFVPKRRITHNTLELQSIYDYAASAGQPLALALLDIRKAFDSVSHEWLDFVMETAGFPPLFRSAVRTITSKGCARVCIGGYLSDALPIERGVRQGCPLSPLLFAVAMDPLLRRLNGLAGPSSLALPGAPDGRYRPWAPSIPSGARMYADDTALVAFSAADLRRMLEIVHEASPLTGLFVNSDKSVVVSPSDEWRDSFPEAEWTHSANYLGVDVGRRGDPDGAWKAAAARSNTLKQRWCGAHVSLRGRAALYNAYSSAHVLQQANINPLSPPARELLTNQMRSFMWSRSQRLMRPDLLELPLREGGLGVQTPEQVVLARRLQQLRELPEARRRGWAWASIWAIALTRAAPYAQALCKPTQTSELAHEALSALQRVGIERLAPTPAERALTPKRLCSQSPDNAPLMWSLAGNEAATTLAASRYGVPIDWPPWQPSPHSLLARWNEAELGYDILAVRNVETRDHGHVLRINTRRLLPDGLLDEEVTQRTSGTAFCTALADGRPNTLLLTEGDTLSRVQTPGGVVLDAAESRDYKSAYRIAKGQVVNPYPRGGFHRRAMLHALFLAWRKIPPRAGAFAWKLFTGRVRPLERLARYNAAEAAKFKHGHCQSCRDGTPEDMAHIVSSCPHSQPVRDRALALYRAKYNYAPLARQFYPIAVPRQMDSRWSIWAMTVWHILWKGRCTVLKSPAPVPFPVAHSIVLLEQAWKVFATLRDKEAEQELRRAALAARRARAPATTH